MNPIIQKLQSNYPELPWDKANLVWDDTDLLKDRGVLSKLVDDHLLLSMDFSVLCRQITEQLHTINEDDVDALKALKTQLVAASCFATILERLYDKCHLNVPSEVRRLRAQKQCYDQLLFPNKRDYFNCEEPDLSSTESEMAVITILLHRWLLFKNWLLALSIVQWVRNTTFRSNLYRLFLARSRRFLDTIQLANLGSKYFSQFTEIMNRYAVPFFTWFAWIFFLPRLLVSGWVLFKNTFYTEGMSEEQRALGYLARFCAQFKRRWFHLGNDVVWVAVGLLNCFLLTGALAPIGAYLTVAAFAYDVILALVNISTELYRLTCLKDQYKKMGQTPEVIGHLKALDERIEFETFRLGINVLSTIAIMLSASLGLPLFASMPLFPLVGALFLVVISLIAFVSNEVVEECRPKDSLTEKELEPLQSKLGFFAQNKQARSNLEIENSLEPCDSECYAY